MDRSFFSFLFSFFLQFSIFLLFSFYFDRNANQEAKYSDGFEAVTISQLLSSDISVAPKISELKSTDSVTVCLCFQDEFVNVEIENTQLVKDLARQVEEKFAIPLKEVGLTFWASVGYDSHNFAGGLRGF